MSYISTYERQLRIQWVWDTPNEFATVLVVVSMVGLAIAAMFLNANPADRILVKGKWCRAISGWLGLFLTIAANVILVFTYSRGGYVSLVCCSLLGLAFSTRLRWIPVLTLSAFFFVLSLAPSGVDRFSKSVDIEGDASVFNRFTLWKGTTAMIADHWLYGVGSDQFYEEYTRWYQEAYSKTRYRNAVNDYLTLGAYYGIPGIGGYVFGVGVLLIIGARIYLYTKDIVLLYLLLAVVSFCVSGLFSTFINNPKVLVALIVALVALTGYGVLGHWRLTVRYIRSACIFSFGLASVSGIIVYTAGSYYTERFHAMPLDVSLSFKEENIEYSGVRPKKLATKGIVVYISDQADALVTANSALVEFASHGYIAFSPNLSNWGKTGLREIDEFLDAIELVESFDELQVLIAGHGEGGRLAILAACARNDLVGVAAIGSPASSPFSVLSPVENIHNLKCPLYLLHGELDKQVHLSEARLLKESAEKASKTVELQVLPETYHNLDDKWPKVIERISEIAEDRTI